MSRWDRESYLQEVCAQIKWKRAHAAARRELGDHIDDQQQAFLEQGLPKGEAAARAVAEMGDPAEAGQRLNRLYRPRVEWKLVALIAVMMVTGVLMRGFNRGWAITSIVATATVFFIGYRLPLYWLVRAPVVLYIALCGSILLLGRTWFPYEWDFSMTPLEQWTWGISGNGGPVVFASAGLPLLFAVVLYKMRGRGYGGIAACMGLALLGRRLPGASSRSVWRRSCRWPLQPCLRLPCGAAGWVPRGQRDCCWSGCRWRRAGHCFSPLYSGYCLPGRAARCSTAWSTCAMPYKMPAGLDRAW